MITIRFCHYHFGIEFWCSITDFRRWDFGHEHRGKLFDTHAWWVGPLHIIQCDTRPRVDVSAASIVDSDGADR